MLDCQLLLRTVGALVSGAGVEGHPFDDPIARPEELRPEEPTAEQGQPMAREEN